MDGDLRRPETRPDPPSGPETRSDEVRRTPGWKKALFGFVGLLVVAALTVAGVLWWLHARQFESTDDAFVDGHISQVSPQVAGRVVALLVADNQRVRAGDVLLRIEPRDYQAKLRNAEAGRLQAAAQLDGARAGLLQQGAAIDQAVAQVRVAEAELGQQQGDLARFRAVDPKAVSRQLLDTTAAQARSASARLDAARQAVAAARAQLEAQKAQVEAAEANVAAAEAAISTARLNLEWTEVRAPQDGQVARRTVELGNYAKEGQSLLAVVAPDMWVTANFKETQLALMRPGQPVRVRVDACPRDGYPGRVDSVQSGTGSVFSALPAENATGNYVKVVQRVPVKITFDAPPDECRLLPGLSVVPRVTVR